MAEEIPLVSDGNSLLSLPFKRRKFVCINYPGVVKNLDKAYETLGGINQISKTYRDPMKRLELKWRPQDIFCKASYGDGIKSCSYLLKVMRRKRQGPDGQETYEFKAVIEGAITVTYKFQGMSDFQYLPVTKEGGKVQGLLPMLSMEGLVSREEYLSRPSPLFVLPPQFSRIDTPVEYMYRQDYTPRHPDSNPSNFRPQHLLGSARRKRTIFTIFVNFEDDNVPRQPLPGAERFLNTKWRNEEMKTLLKKLFEERPIWSKCALIPHFPAEYAPRLKYGLPLVAYYFLTGPWRTLWVRMGYDPRKEPKAKIYQVLNYRLRRSVCGTKSGEGMPRKRVDLMGQLPKKQRKVEKVIHISAMEEDSQTDSPTKTVKDESYVYRPGVPPPQLQMYYQLCDIHEEEVQRLVHSNDSEEGDVCDKDNGFCAPRCLDDIRGILDSQFEKYFKSNPTSRWRVFRKKHDADSDADEEDEEDEDEEYSDQEDMDVDEDDDGDEEDDGLTDMDREVLNPV